MKDRFEKKKIKFMHLVLQNPPTQLNSIYAYKLIKCTFLKTHDSYILFTLSLNY